MIPIVVNAASKDQAGVIVGIYFPSWLTAYPNQVDLATLSIEESASMQRGMKMQWTKALENTQSSIRIAWIGDVPVGFIQTIVKKPGAVTLRALYVVPEFQDKGVGSALVKGMIEEIARPSLINIEVVQGDEPLKRFYERKGFRIVGELDPSPITNYPDRKVFPGYRMEQRIK